MTVCTVQVLQKYYKFWLDIALGSPTKVGHN
jgi:hypothetical protein